MYPTISIQNSKGVAAQELENLGRINILCGPNSSGKSTILEAIASFGSDPSQKNDAFSTNKIHVKFIPCHRSLISQDDWKISRNLFANGDCLLPHLLFCRNQKEKSIERIYYDKLHKAFQQVTCGYNFDINISESKEKSSRSHFNNSGVIKLSFKSPNDGVVRPAKDFGLGLHEVFVVLAVSIWGKEKVVCLEEPETHIHPDIQRRLLSFFRNELDKQFFISTHSSIFIQPSITDRIFYTNYKDGSVHLDDITSKATILHNLGYSVTDNLVSDLIILVEGPTDVPVIEEFLEKYRLLQRHIIKIWPLGGDIMDKHDLTVLCEKYRTIALIDQDPGSSSVRKRFLKKCKELGIENTQLNRYAIENYFTLNALRCVFNNQISSDLFEINPDKPLKDQIHMDVKKNNRKIARAMSLKDIKETDLEKFFQRVCNILTEQ